MHDRAFDLNLLPVFSAMLAHGNVSRAAEHLGLTQPAVSHALARLRTHYDDPLFQRVRNRMVPTARALEIAPSVEAALDMLKATFDRDFSERELQRTFRIALVNYSGFYLLPALTERLCVDAPRVEIIPEQMGPDVALGLMATREIDFAVGVFPRVPEEFERELVIHSECGVLMRKEHPLVHQAMTPEILAQWRRVRIPIFSSYPVEQALPAADYAITCPDLLSVPLIVARSNLLAIVPTRLGRLFEAFTPVTTIRLSPDFPPFDVELIAPNGRKIDAAQQWLKAIISEICQGIDVKIKPYYMMETL